MTLRKNGNELGTTDAAELERVSTEASVLQKSLENYLQAVKTAHYDCE